MVQSTGHEVEEPEAKGSIVAWKESPAKALLGQLPQWLWACSASGTDVEMTPQAERQLPPLACQDSSQRLEHKSRHWSHPDPWNKSCTVHTPSTPPPSPSGQDRVRQGHPWRPETGHPGSKGAKERSHEFQGQGCIVRPASRKRACAHAPESRIAEVATSCSRHL